MTLKRWAAKRQTIIAVRTAVAGLVHRAVREAVETAVLVLASQAVPAAAQVAPAAVLERVLQHAQVVAVVVQALVLGAVPRVREHVREAVQAVREHVQEAVPVVRALAVVRALEHAWRTALAAVNRPVWERVYISVTTAIKQTVNTGALEHA